MSFIRRANLTYGNAHSEHVCLQRSTIAIVSQSCRKVKWEGWVLLPTPASGRWRASRWVQAVDRTCGPEARAPRWCCGLGDIVSDVLRCRSVVTPFSSVIECT